MARRLSVCWMHYLNLEYFLPGEYMLVKEIEIKTMSDYMQKIRTLRKASHPLWFRGIHNSKYKLNPSLYRIKQKDKEQWANLETSIIERFKERSLPYLPYAFNDSWAWLFFMQHHGVPTRLLDWTENPFIALFFALDEVDTNIKGKAKNDSLVWVLDPIEWNRKVLAYQSFSGTILSTSDEQLTPFTPVANFKTLPDYPLAINGIYNSKRIVAQKGTFTIFGAPGTSLEDYYTKAIDIPCLTKLIIRKDVVFDLLEEVLNSGITETVVFPDLDGLAREIKREFGYGARK